MKELDVGNKELKVFSDFKKQISFKMDQSNCHCSLSFSSQPEGATSEEKAVLLSEERLPESGSGSGVIRVKPGFNSSDSTGTL